MNYDLEYALNEVRSWAKEHFDEDGCSYTGTGISPVFAEMMWKLIQDMEEEILQLELERGAL